MDMNVSDEQLKELSKGDPEQIYATLKILMDTIVMLQQEVKELKRQIGQNSNTSSKPPSSHGYRKPTNLRQSGARRVRHWDTKGTH